jgi:hypothetical protein
MMLATVKVQAADPEARRIVVCIDGNINLPVASMARTMASQMFDRAGVAVRWHAVHCLNPAGSIRITFGTKTPASSHPRAIAYALPYKDTHVRVFYDRILDRSTEPRCIARLLAHVLVHEITHILQGVNRHSDWGIMKARWDADDLQKMAWKPLAFTPDDIVLIHRGLDVLALPDR